MPRPDSDLRRQDVAGDRGKLQAAPLAKAAKNEIILAEHLAERVDDVGEG